MDYSCTIKLLPDVGDLLIFPRAAAKDDISHLYRITFNSFPCVTKSLSP